MSNRKFETVSHSLLEVKGRKLPWHYAWSIVGDYSWLAIIISKFFFGNSLIRPELRQYDGTGTDRQADRNYQLLRECTTKKTYKISKIQ